MDRVAASALEPGDYLVGSGRVVLGVTRQSLRLPAGKVEVTVSGRYGVSCALWNAGTKIGIERGYRSAV